MIEYLKFETRLPVAAAIAAVLAVLSVPCGASAVVVGDESVFSAADEAVRSAFSEAEDLEVRWSKLPRLGVLEGQNLDIHASLLRDMDNRGPVFVEIEFRKGSSIVGKRSATAKVSVYKEILVAAENVDRHTVIGPGSVKLERHDIRAQRGKCLTSVESAVGLRATRIITAGKPVFEESVEMIPLVRRGQKVLLVVSIGGITVSAHGTSQGDGVRGEEITVKNDRSGKRLSGIVVNEGVVRVELNGLTGMGG